METAISGLFFMVFLILEKVMLFFLIIGLSRLFLTIDYIIYRFRRICYVMNISLRTYIFIKIFVFLLLGFNLI